MTCWEEIRRSHFQESPNPIGQLGVVLTQHHWAEVFLEEVNGQGGRTLLSQRPCDRDQGEPYSNPGFRLWSIQTAWTGMGSVRLNFALETP